MTRPRKFFKAASVDEEGHAPELRLVSTKVHFPPNISEVKSFEFVPWLNIGMDEVVYACMRTALRMVADEKPRTSTVVSYCRSGLRYFLDFCVQRQVTSLEQISGDLLLDYVAWLKVLGASYQTQRSRYTHTKAVLVDLIVHGVLDRQKVVFPVNPYPGADEQSAGLTTPLGWEERKRFISALKADLILIAKDGFDGTDAAAIVVLMLAVALRTGLNTSPLLELRTDCLKPHPLLKGQLLLRYVKYRSASDGRTVVRAPRTDVDDRRAGMDVAAIVQLVVRRTAHLRQFATAKDSDLLWLFQPADRSLVPRVVTPRLLAEYVQWFVNRHKLADEQGRPLVITVRRLRKTLENRLWHLSGGDLRAVARAMNHLPAVADAHYLLPSPEAERNHHFLGQILVASWRSTDEAGATAEATPVGRCADPINGANAPKTGEACMDFMSCFTCRSFVLVEDERDLHRLFSFYWFLHRERANASSLEWRAHYAATIELIDAVTGSRFDSVRVAKAREAAHEKPIRFWRDPVVAEAIRGSA